MRYFINSQQHFELELVPYLHTKKLQIRETKCPAQSCTVSKWLTSGVFHSDVLYFNDVLLCKQTIGFSLPWHVIGMALTMLLTAFGV